MDETGSKIPRELREVSRETSIPIPEMYRVIETGDVAKIVQQIFKEYYNSLPRDVERVYLGFDALIRAGQGSEPALRHIAMDTGELGGVARQILENPSDLYLEKILGVERGFKPSAVPDFRDIKTFEPCFNHARDRGFIDDDHAAQSAVNFATHYYRCVTGERRGQPPQLTGDTGREIIKISATFGAYEPEYCELNGPAEILRLRSMPNPNFLLLGSLGIYSAREFAMFTRKINPNSQPSVIDIDPQMTQRLQAYQGENGLDFKWGDALKMPFPNESQDQIYTNFLLSRIYIDKKGRVAPDRDDVLNFLKEVRRALKPGGSFIIIDRAYNTTGGRSRTYQETRTELVALAQNLGFTLEKEMGANTVSICFRAEVPNPNKPHSGVSINSNGFPHYEDLFLTLQPDQKFCLRLKKT